MSARDDIPAAELLPCPFCGGPASVRPDEVGSCGQHVPPYWAGCPLPAGCGVVFQGDYPNEAADAWNTRADRSSRPAQHEADRDRAAEEERIREDERASCLAHIDYVSKNIVPNYTDRKRFDERHLQTVFKGALQLAKERITGEDAGKWEPDPRAALRSSPHKGGTETADTPHEPDCAYHLDQYPNECDCARRGGGDER